MNPITAILLIVCLVLIFVPFFRYVDAIDREQQEAREYYANRQRRRNQGLPND